MKFGKVILQQGRELPGKQFLRYKQLKKMLKQIEHPVHREGNCEEAADCGTSTSELATRGSHTEEEPNALTAASNRPGILSAKETEFIKALNEELANLNSTFMDEEESIVIRLQDLENDLNEARDSMDNEEEVRKLAKAFIDFHGEIVMLLHWGHVNYVAVTKILKKHDKRTGLPLHAPCIENVLQQPFFSTDLLQRLAKRVGAIVDDLISTSPTEDSTLSESHDDKATMVEAPVEDPERAVEEPMRRTHMALGMWRDLKANASTPSTLVHVDGELGAAAQQGQEETVAGASPGPNGASGVEESEDSKSVEVPPTSRKHGLAPDEEPRKNSRRRLC
eukprot:evm.model.scf_666.3 EVM.evm.TU.scf_666.3   scf_666:11918-14659(-)